jgi:hypothetical protein
VRQQEFRSSEVREFRSQDRCFHALKARKFLSPGLTDHKQHALKVRVRNVLCARFTSRPILFLDPPSTVLTFCC